MAIVEDEMRNDSEDENEIEVVVEEDVEQDSEDSDDDDDEEVVERKVAELERKVTEDPYNYDSHIELIQALWSMSELNRWRAAFDRLQEHSLVKPEHWLLRLQTEVTLAHTAEARENIAELFRQATLDCYSIPILSEWCTWALGLGDVRAARAQIDEVLRRAGADPLSGKIFWDAKLELEKSQLDNLNTQDPQYKAQQELVLFCLEETVSRPLLRADDAWQQLEEIAHEVHQHDYLEKVKKQHEAALDYLQRLTPYEDKLLTIENTEEKFKMYQEYIDAVKTFSQQDRYAECDSSGIIKVLYDRATSECVSCGGAGGLLAAQARYSREVSSRSSYWRTLHACTRRCPRRAAFWVLKMHQAEHEDKHFDEVKSILEAALSKGMESYKQAEALWLSYLEYIRRRTMFEKENDVEKLRRTFRLAWDSLAETWGDEANDCEVPLYWARLEYKRVKDIRQGKDIFEELFKYGENKTMSKYWEAFIHLESTRDPPPSENKLRELHRRALKFVSDYPPAIVRLWTDFERDFGQLSNMRECMEVCETKIKEWRDNYQAMKDKMTGQKQKGKQAQSKKEKAEQKKKKADEPKNKGKRKSDESHGSDKKRKKDDMEVEEKEKVGESSAVKRSLEDDDEGKEACGSKRQRVDSTESETTANSREACTLFVSNLEFKVDESSLKEKLSEFGDIVSMRVKAGVKAFGGSICYCQYTSSEAVAKALKHDRTPLNGRPMFLSAYSSKKGKASFKYATTTENNKLFVRNLPFGHCTKKALAEIFDKYGKLKDIRIVTFKDGKPKGLAYIDYEDENAASEALQKTNGLVVADRKIEVAVSAPPARAEQSTSGVALGQPKRDTGGGMRRTQLSKFIPSVLQRTIAGTSNTESTASTSNGNSNGNEKQQLSNSDFRNMLLKK